METINEIKTKFSNTPPENLTKLIEEYHSDTRKGVQNILSSSQKKNRSFSKRTDSFRKHASI